VSGSEEGTKQAKQERNAILIVFSRFLGYNMMD
jgi:hypothetical protein